MVGMLVFGLGSMLLALFLSRVSRFSCFVSDFGMGGCSLVLVSHVGGWAIDRIVWARRWLVSVDGFYY